MLCHYTHMHQWYKINANEIFENHKLALCTNQLTHKITIPQAEPQKLMHSQQL